MCKKQIKSNSFPFQRFIYSFSIKIFFLLNFQNIPLLIRTKYQINSFLFVVQKQIHLVKIKNYSLSIYFQMILFYFKQQNFIITSKTIEIY